MLKYLRYALTMFCLAASVGCLALWWRSLTRTEQVGGGISYARSLAILTFCGGSNIGVFEIVSPEHIPWIVRSEIIDPKFRLPPPNSRFWFDGRTIYFPGWYPALIVAFAGVAALMLGRRFFTLRSAMSATTIVVGLLGERSGQTISRGIRYDRHNPTASCCQDRRQRDNLLIAVCRGNR